MRPTLHIAKMSDSMKSASLVNRAYRPASTEFGWTHEAQLVAGYRISPEQVEELFNGDSIVLVLLQDEHIVSCVNVVVKDSVAYIGMLATSQGFRRAVWERQ